MTDGPPEVAYIVGFDYRSVVAFCRDDLGWRRVEPGLWIDDDGRYVRFARGIATFGRQASGRRVYFVGEFHQREDWWALDDAIRGRGCDRYYL